MNNPMILANVKEDFYLNFIKDDRYLWLLDGLKTTLIITVFAVIVGLIIGFLVSQAPLRSSMRSAEFI